MGGSWIKVIIPRRPKAYRAWVRRQDLGPLNATTVRLVIDRRALRATLYREARPVWRSPIGVGKRGTLTPAGSFYVRERLVPRDPRGFYGPLAFGTSAYSRTLTDWPNGGVIGIHGTNQPQLIPGRPSHGCIRIPNAKIRHLDRLMRLGTPVRIV